MMQRTGDRRRGGAGVWLVAVIAVAVVVIVIVLAWRSGPSGPAGGPPSAEDYARLETLQAKLRSAIANKRPATPLVDEAEDLVARYPQMLDARVTLAQLLMLTRQEEQAYEQFTEVLRQEPQRPQVQVLAGSLLMEMDRPVEAEVHYRAAVDMEPAVGQHRVFLAQALVEQGRLEDAERTLVEALGVDSTLHAANGMLADIYAQQGQLELALSQAQRARARTPREKAATWAAYTRRYARLLREADQPAEALLVLRELPPETHFDPEVAEDMAAAWSAMGQPRKAAEHYEAALGLNPLDEASAASAAQWYLASGDSDDARRMVEEVRRINPRSRRLPDLEAAVQTHAD